MIETIFVISFIIILVSNTILIQQLNGHKHL